VGSVEDAGYDDSCVLQTCCSKKRVDCSKLMWMPGIFIQWFQSKHHAENLYSKVGRSSWLGPWIWKDGHWDCGILRYDAAERGMTMRAHYPFIGLLACIDPRSTQAL
jgi:hypothetical protein